MRKPFQKIYNEFYCTKTGLITLLLLIGIISSIIPTFMLILSLSIIVYTVLFNIVQIRLTLLTMMTIIVSTCALLIPMIDPVMS